VEEGNDKIVRIDGEEKSAFSPFDVDYWETLKQQCQSINFLD
jgi:hypothetical protein